METRKIQQVGGGTYTVSLPKEWATAADIEPGSVVTLHTHIDGTLVVKTGDEEPASTLPLRLSVGGADPDAVDRALRAVYAAGIETVELRAASPDGVDDALRRRIERVTRGLTGLAVTETTGDTVRVRSLLDAEEVSIPQSVRQLQFAALSAHRTATAAVTNSTTIERPDDRDDQAARIFAMVDRYFGRGLDSLSVMDALGLTRPQLFVHWETARELRRVAGEARRIAAVANRLESPVEGPVATPFEALAADSRTLVEDAVSAVLDDGNVATVRVLLAERDRLLDTAESLDRRLFETDGADYRLTNAVDSLARTVDSAGAIATLSLRSQFREDRGTDIRLAGTDDGRSAADADAGG